ncbi:MAG: SAM-dependent chlorinase/fluorinase, partial [Proteobacteria bacterium]|nr:SAM-dependent chlorinase/fluorinase [Pseudomonadota bacterium]
MIVLFTDFGPTGPYTGQMIAALRKIAPHVPVIDLLSNAPAFDPQASAYLLSALIRDFPDGSVFLGVVDPGVGGDRAPV